MKFDRRQRIPAFEWTRRKLLAAQSRPARQHARELARYPLFADQTPAPAPMAFDPHVEARLREQCARDSEQRMRDLFSRVWRESRRDMQHATHDQQQAIREAWGAWTGPRTSLYFRYVVDVHTGVMAAREAALAASKALARDELRRAAQLQQSLEFNPAVDRRSSRRAEQTCLQRAQGDI